SLPNDSRFLACRDVGWGHRARYHRFRTVDGFATDGLRADFWLAHGTSGGGRGDRWNYSAALDGCDAGGCRGPLRRDGRDTVGGLLGHVKTAGGRSGVYSGDGDSDTLGLRFSSPRQASSTSQYLGGPWITKCPRRPFG